MPVRVDNPLEHRMHAEICIISENSADRINRAKREGRRVVALGTTSARAIEHSAGDNGIILPGRGETDIFIYPGYRFKVVDALITNFHLPKSTLMMMVSAFAGRENALHAYEEAVRKRFRFFSYGDAMFIY
jgi:S-adenosylmethionine:tRNA ribosyltransferase-isomerase